MSAHVKVGVVGTGFIGPVHVEALRRIGAEVVGIVASSQEVAERKAVEMRVPGAFTSLDQLLAVPGLDAVHITTPNHLHGPMVRQVVAAGKHVVCEKPLAMDAAEAQQLLEVAEAAGVCHAVNFNLRFYPHCHESRARVQAGEIGRTFVIHGAYLQDWLLGETDWNWRLEPEFSGQTRAIADIGSHWLDLTGFITGEEVAEVCADFSTVIPLRKKPTRPLETFAGKELRPDEYEEKPIRTEDWATVMLRYASGIKGVFSVSQVSAGRKNHLRFEIDGSNASLAWCSERPEELFIGRRDRPSETFLRDPALLAPEARAITSYPGGHAEGFPDTFKQLYRKFYADVERGKPSANPDYPTFRDGVKSMRLGDAILRSAREGRWVAVE